jgi:hypothetical protein
METSRWACHDDSNSRRAANWTSTLLPNLEPTWHRRKEVQSAPIGLADVVRLTYQFYVYSLLSSLVGPDPIGAGSPAAFRPLHTICAVIFEEEFVEHFH